MPGVLYSGRRDPSALFEALALLGPERQRIRIEFYGSDPALSCRRLKRRE